MCCVGGRKGKGRGGGGGGGGGGGRGVRGVDFGLGIGYKSESNTSSSVPSRSAAVNSLRTGMMAQFRSNFVAASSSPQDQGFSSSTSMSANKRPALRGFVSGGSIGGDINTTQSTASFSPAMPEINATIQNTGVDASQNNTERWHF